MIIFVFQGQIFLLFVGELALVRNNWPSRPITLPHQPSPSPTVQQGRAGIHKHLESLKLLFVGWGAGSVAQVFAVSSEDQI